MGGQGTRHRGHEITKKGRSTPQGEGGRGDDQSTGPRHGTHARGRAPRLGQGDDGRRDGPSREAQGPGRGPHAVPRGAAPEARRHGGAHHVRRKGPGPAHARRRSVEEVALIILPFLSSSLSNNTILS